MCFLHYLVIYIILLHRDIGAFFSFSATGEKEKVKKFSKKEYSQIQKKQNKYFPESSGPKWMFLFYVYNQPFRCFSLFFDRIKEEKRRKSQLAIGVVMEMEINLVGNGCLHCSFHLSVRLVCLTWPPRIDASMLLASVYSSVRCLLLFKSR